MSIRNEAEENLRVIRSLMEKATVYRAISAPGALVAGIGSVTVATGGFWLSHPWFNVPSDAFRFIVPWLALLVIVTVVNLLLLAREAARRGERFVSPGMRLALRAMLPALLAGGVVSLPFSLSLELVPLQASVWVLLYGVSLLAAAHFAPKSICWLGRAFFAAGVGCFIVWSPVPELLGHPVSIANPREVAHGLMGATFGLFHIVYAALIWPRRGGAEL